MTRPMTDEEMLNFKDVVKCNWLRCAGGMGLAGCGCCSFRGDYRKIFCPKFIDEIEYEKNQGNFNDTTKEKESSG